MLEVILVILIILWLLGYVVIPGIVIPNLTLFMLGRFPITLWDVLIFLIVMWAIGILPSPFREILAVLFIIWVLSTVGILAVVGLSHILVVSIIVGLIIYLLFGH